uniref:LITAF domain-containing protein n=1 Tax=Steinernema glaseri TaxID=37863 RepID=A0A1I7Z3H7_9BILA
MDDAEIEERLGVKRCDKCTSGLIEKHYTPVGLLICIATVMCCGIGIFIARVLREDHCAQCYSDEIEQLGPTLRAKRLFIHDKSKLKKPKSFMQEKDFSDEVVGEEGGGEE